MSSRIFNNECLNYDYGYTSSWAYKTDVSQMAGGGEQRRARWEKPLRKFSLPFNNKTIPNLQKLITFFHDHKGSYESFYFLDNDNRNIWTVLPKYKHITTGHVDFIITEWTPVSLSIPINISTVPNFTTDIIVKINGTQRTSDMSIDLTNNKITFTANTPLSTDVISVEYTHLIKVRFANDAAELTGTFYNTGNMNIELQEVR